MVSQLKLGMRVEREHKGTVAFINSYYKKHHAIPPATQIYTQISKDHIGESKTYYSRLKKAKL